MTATPKTTIARFNARHFNGTMQRARTALDIAKRYASIADAIYAGTMRVRGARGVDVVAWYGDNGRAIFEARIVAVDGRWFALAERDSDDALHIDAIIDDDDASPPAFAFGKRAHIDDALAHNEESAMLAVETIDAVVERFADEAERAAFDGVGEIARALRDDAIALAQRVRRRFRTMGGVC